MTPRVPSLTFPASELPTLLENMPFPVLSLNQNLEIIYYNKSFVDFMHVDCQDANSLCLHHIMPEFQPTGLHSVNTLRKYMDEAFTKGIVQTQWTMLQQNAHILSTKISLTPAGQDKDCNYFIYIHHENPCKNCQAEAAKTIEFINNTLDTMPLIMQIWSQDLQMVDCSKEVTRMFGLEDKEEYRKNFMAYSPEYQVDGLSKDLMPEYLEKALAEGSYKFQWLRQDSSGKTFPTEETLCRVTFQGEDFVLGYTQDISAVTDSIKNIIHMEERTRAILDATPMAILLWDKNFKLRDTNLEALNIYGYEDKYDFLQDFHKILPELQPSGELSTSVLTQALKQAFEHGQHHMSKFFCNTIDGEELPVEMTTIRIVLRDETMVIAYLHDLREILRVLDAMKSHEQRIQAILDATPMAINLWDANRTLRDTNLECLRLFGFENKENYKAHFEKLHPKHLPDGSPATSAALQRIDKAFDTGYLRYESTLPHSDGTKIPLEVTLIRVNVDDEPMLIAYLRDLREIKDFINKITESEERTQAILDLSPLGINVWDKNKNLVDCNKAIVRLFGFQGSSEYIKNRYQVMPEHQPNGAKSMDVAIHKIDEAFALGQSHVEVTAIDVHGNTIPMDIMLKRAVLGGQEVVIGYMRDLRELKAMLAEIHAVEQDLRSARDVAVQSARAKSEFLANMSHEIRTPLNGVLGLLHLLGNTTLEKMQRDYVDKTIFSAENLLRIINDILDFSKIDAGKLEMENIPFSLHEVASELKMLFEPQANGKNLALTFKYDGCTKHQLLGDPLRIKQVFFNLIGNAIKFTEIGGITISMTGKEESPGKIHCLFSVKDTGIGMNEDQRGRLFSAFMQADTSVTRKYGGTGLGLVIAQRISRLMHGDLWVESTEGEGSCFFFSAIFDFASEAAQAQTEQQELQAPCVGDEDLASLGDMQKDAPASQTQAPCHAQNDHENKDCPAPQNPNLTAEGQRSCHILLVEDNEINQLIAEELLKNAGHTVNIANNGQEALDLLEKNNYHIILMDIQMPVLDGLSTVGKIRADARFAHMPVIAMSAHAMTGDREISLHHGMNEHITKPISPAILYETVNTWALTDEAVHKK